jgi:hypothetical protein
MSAVSLELRGLFSDLGIELKRNYSGTFRGRLGVGLVKCVFIVW